MRVWQLVDAVADGQAGVARRLRQAVLLRRARHRLLEGRQRAGRAGGVPSSPAAGADRVARAVVAQQLLLLQVLRRRISVKVVLREEDGLPSTAVQGSTG